MSNYNIVLRDYLTLTEAAQRLGLTYAQLRSYVRAGVFPTATKIRGTRWYIHLNDLNKFVTGEISIEGVFKKEK
jgi:excisionase family DNA binding protein